MSTLERWYHISDSGKLSMKPETPRECPEFRRNLRRLIDAKMHRHYLSLTNRQL